MMMINIEEDDEIGDFDDVGVVVDDDNDEEDDDDNNDNDL